MFDAFLTHCLLLWDQLRDVEYTVEWGERYGQIRLDDEEHDAWMDRARRELKR